MFLDDGLPGVAAPTVELRETLPAFWGCLALDRGWMAEADASHCAGGLCVRDGGILGVVVIEPGWKVMMRSKDAECVVEM